MAAPATAVLADDPPPPAAGSSQVPYYDHPLSRKAFEYRNRRGLFDGSANVAVAVVDATDIDVGSLPENSCVDVQVLEGDDVALMKYLDNALYEAVKPGEGVRKLLVITTANVPCKTKPPKCDKKKKTEDEDDKGIHSEELILDLLAKKGINLDRLLALYSERQPCPGRCRPNIPGTAQVSHTLPYESPASASGRLCNERSRLELEQLIKQAREKKAAEEEAERQAAKAPAPSGAPFEAPGVEGEGARARAGAVSQLSGSAPGGIDFSTLELRYIADLDSTTARGVRYAFQAQPGKGNAAAALGVVQEASDAFFVWLELPTWKFTVNLNPAEADRIVDDDLGRTDAGRILLEADLQMKKTVARLIHPDTSLGARFWNALDKGSGGQFCAGFRQWIVPAPATVQEGQGELYILDAPLSVKMESEYLEAQGLAGGLGACPKQDQAAEAHNEQVFRTMILPQVEHAVNTAPEYESLRRVYLSRVAAEWYRRRHQTEPTSFDPLIDKGNVAPWASRQPWSPADVFNRYVQSLNEGEFRVTHQTQTGSMIETRTYVFGGVDFTEIPNLTVSAADFQSRWPDLPAVVQRSLDGPSPQGNGRALWLGGITYAPVRQASVDMPAGSPAEPGQASEPGDGTAPRVTAPGESPGRSRALRVLTSVARMLVAVGAVVFVGRRLRRRRPSGKRNRLP